MDFHSKNGVENQTPASRMGLFGGTFDPVHQGHLTAAEKVKNAFALKAVVFIPSAVPPHKEGDRVTRAGDRLAMLQRAVDGKAGFSVSDCEIRRPGPSYTVDTVRFFQENTPKDIRMYWIMGHDAFMEMHTWKSHLQILAQIPLIVMQRPGYTVPHPRNDRGPLDAFIKETLSADYYFYEDDTRYVHPRLKPIHLFRNALLDISATDIRKHIQNGNSICALVPEPVETYIREKGLYR